MLVIRFLLYHVGLLGHLMGRRSKIAALALSPMLPLLLAKMPLPPEHEYRTAAIIAPWIIASVALGDFGIAARLGARFATYCGVSTGQGFALLYLTVICAFLAAFASLWWPIGLPLVAVLAAIEIHLRRTFL